jgi:integrase/recombinase XerD
MRTHFVPDDRPTLERAIQTYCTRKLVSPDYRPTTQSSYGRALREFLQLCVGLVYADELDLASVRRYEQDLARRQLRATSQHLKLAAVKAFLSYLEEQEVLSTFIAHTITLPKPERTRPTRPVDIDDAALLMRAVREARQPRDIAVITLLLSTGILLTELIGLTLSDLQLAPVQADTQAMRRDSRSFPAIPTVTWGSLRLRNRTSAQQQATLLDEATAQALNAYLAVRPPSPHPHLFLSMTGAPLTLQAAWGIVKRYARAAGLPWIQARALRSGFIMQQLAAGAAVSEVQNKIGHRQITTTRRYTGLVGSSPRGTVAHRRSCGVLIVDKDQPARRQLRSILEDAGHLVFEASDFVGGRDMLRLSRLSLVVLLHLRAPLWESAELLSDLPPNENLLADHRMVVVFAGNDQLPKQMSDTLVACDIPIMTRPVDLNALLIYIRRAYGELGALSAASKGWSTELGTPTVVSGQY